MVASGQRLISIRLASEEGRTGLVGTNFDDVEGDWLCKFDALDDFHDVGSWISPVAVDPSKTVGGG